MKELLGIPASASAGFVTGGQAGNTAGLAAARHYLLAGAGWDVERDGLAGAPAVRVAALEAALRDGPAGPAVVCLQAGNVNTGACDDLRAGCDIAHRYRAWVHVDGAFGLWAAANPATRHLVDGVELADSWACDGHKWLNVPYDCGFAFCSLPEAHRRTVLYGAVPDRFWWRGAEPRRLHSGVLSPGARLRHLGGVAPPGPLRRVGDDRTVLQAGSALRRRAGRRRGGDRQRGGAEPGTCRVR
ncbi:MAG: pyridoxal-dependent decarboxylase [Mycobacterium sp.]